MTLETSFNVVEPYVKRFLPSQPYAPAWCTMWLEQRNVANPTELDLANAVNAYQARVKA